jgi:DNA polymerase-3 subunit gamma/tau
MTYTALARKWRPRRFDELTGQEHVLRALSNALASGRVHHAFLFTGTRGVGKTTISRIFAKCLNCETGVTPAPCGTCASCREIDEGRFVDLIEVDAASRTKVDDTRELLENVQYAPTRGRYKVYLIDEVHMLSSHSFNALLKTLEEPPPHVKFLLATTDPQKLPVTVLSRCLQFNLKRLPVGLIAERMRSILDAEQVPSEPAALRLVAEAADGSMRDGLSLLDQLIAFGGGRVAESDARAMLATVDRQHIVRLAGLLADGDPAPLLEFARSLEQWAPDYGAVLDGLASLLVRVAMRQAVPGYEGDEIHGPELLADLAGRMSAEDAQLWYQTAILGRRDLDWAPDPRSGFDMTLLRMLAFRPAGAESGSPAPAGSLPASNPRPSPRLPDPAAPPPARPTAAADPALEVTPASWPAVLATLELGGAARQLASNCAFVGREGGLLRLRLDPAQQLLRTPALVERLAQALSRLLGEPVRVEVDVAEGMLETPARLESELSAQQVESARQAIEADPAVRAMRERLGATLRADSVRPPR